MIVFRVLKDTTVQVVINLISTQNLVQSELMDLQQEQLVVQNALLVMQEAFVTL